MKENMLVDREASTNQVRSEDSGQADSFVPVRMIEIELGQPLPTITALDAKKGSYYRRARCLVRLHTQPLGLVELIIDTDELSPGEYAPHVWQALSEQINEHLRQDGLSPVTALTAAGLPNLLTPQCIEERESFLQTAPFVSIIVSTRDRPEDLARCLQALMALHYPRYEVIVVDNAPTTTATADFIQQAYSDEPRIQYMRENHPGSSLARNCGIMAARGEIFAFTDDDTVVDAYWLAELVKAFSSRDKVACVTSLVSPLELETQAQAWFEEYGGFDKGFTRRIFDRSGSADIPLYPFAAGRFGTGAGMAFTAAFLRSEGGFDPALGPGTRAGGGEDLAAFFRVIIGGYQLVYEPASLLYHLHRRGYAHLQKQIYHYGSGLTAYLTKIILENPLLLFNILANAPYGLFFILSSRSPKNRKKSKNYPQELSALERKGMLYGPLAYVLSRWALGRTHKRPVVVEENTHPSATRDGLASPS